jgi:hypothetical protein
MRKNGLTTLVKTLRRAVRAHSAGERTDAYLIVHPVFDVLSEKENDDRPRNHRLLASSLGCP